MLTPLGGVQQRGGDKQVHSVEFLITALTPTLPRLYPEANPRHHVSFCA